MHVLMTSLWTCPEFSWQDTYPALMKNFPGLGMALGREKAWESPREEGCSSECMVSLSSMYVVVLGTHKEPHQAGTQT